MSEENGKINDLLASSDSELKELWGKEWLVQRPSFRRAISELKSLPVSYHLVQKARERRFSAGRSKNRKKYFGAIGVLEPTLALVFAIYVGSARDMATRSKTIISEADEQLLFSDMSSFFSDADFNFSILDDDLSYTLEGL